jgi:pantoate--beta-alanine ligase
VDVACLARLAVVRTVSELRQKVAAGRAQGARIGLVPTMGALHEGHLSLMRAARQECDLVVVTIFVNPTQFGPAEDFQKYPRDLDRDAFLCEQSGVDLIFHPSVEEVYPAGFCSFVEVEGLSGVLEGKFRPGHFRGVATVVLKLFEMAGADVAYFGQKDYQQQTIIRRMCRDLNLPIEIRVCPTVREPDGLALSSRNIYLSAGERQSALALSRALNLARERVTAGECDFDAIRRAMLDLLESTPFVRPDYATLVHPDSLEEVSRPLAKLVAVVAARVGATRLIDNLIIEVPARKATSGATGF